MSALAGWQGSVGGADAERILRCMGDVLSGPGADVRVHRSGGFCVVTTEPAVAGGTDRIAASDDGRVILAFAGYLFTEDRHEQAHPARHCLDQYLRYGRTFAEGLNGSFGIVIHDLRSSELHLVTDRLGTRPLFYSAGEPFLFGSEVKAILEFPGVSGALDPSPLLAFLVRGHLFGLETYYDHIRRAPEASVTTWDGARVESVRYWAPPFGAEQGRDLEENARRTYAALQNAARRACFGVERPALMLSGGLDSRALASACASPLLCLTLHTHDWPEVRTARRVARTLGHGHEFVPVPTSYPWDLVPEGSLISDGLHAFRHAQGLYLAGVLADRGIQAVLSGGVLEEVLAALLLPSRGLGRGALNWGGPALPTAGDCDLVDELWRSASVADLPHVRRLVPGDRVDEAVAHARSAIAAVVSRIDDGVTHPYVLYAFALLTSVASAPGMLNIHALDRLAPPRMIAGDTEVLDLFFTVPVEHRLCQRLYAALFTRVDRRCRWIPYNNTGVPMTSSHALAYLGALHQRLVRRACSGVNQLLGRNELRSYWNGWPPIGIRCPEWQPYLQRKVEASRLVDLGLLSGNGLRSLISHLPVHVEGDWPLVERWITLEEWLSHYG